MEYNLLLSGHSGEVLSVAYNHSTTLLASGGTDKSIFLWAVEESYLNTGVLKTGIVTSLRFTYTDRLLCSSADKSVTLFDVELLKPIRRYRGHRCIVHDVNTPQKASDIFASVGDDSCAKGWDPRSKAQIFSFQGKYPLTSVCFSLSGERLFVGGIDNVIAVYDLRSKEAMEKIIGHQDTISSLEVSYDGTYLLSNSFDETARVWDVRAGVTKRLVKTLAGHVQGHDKALIRAGWSKDGLYACCGSIDKCLYIWDTTTKMIVQKLGGHSGTVNQVIMGHNNKLASCSNDKTIIVSQLPEIFL